MFKVCHSHFFYKITELVTFQNNKNLEYSKNHSKKAENSKMIQRMRKTLKTECSHSLYIDWLQKYTKIQPSGREPNGTCVDTIIILHGEVQLVSTMCPHAPKNTLSVHKREVLTRNKTFCNYLSLAFHCFGKIIKILGQVTIGGLFKALLKWNTRTEFCTL